MIRAYYLISAVAVAHLVMGYYLIVAPQKIATQSTIFILGEALGLVRVLWCGMVTFIADSLFLSNNQSPRSTKIPWGVRSPVLF